VLGGGGGLLPLTVEAVGVAGKQRQPAVGHVMTPAPNAVCVAERRYGLAANKVCGRLAEELTTVLSQWD